jgi:endonuclease YncB( thermonuclease family)
MIEYIPIPLVIGGVLAAFEALAAWPVSDGGVVAVKPASNKVIGKLLGTVDGDTVHIEIDGEKKTIRIAYIDSPESNFYGKKQRQGEESKQNLINLCAPHIGKDVEVQIIGRDVHQNRLDGLVSVGGVDVSTYQVRTGYAWTYPGYNKNPELPKLQAIAKEKRLGLWWDSEPTPPWQWRKELRDSYRAK